MQTCIKLIEQNNDRTQIMREIEELSKGAKHPKGNSDFISKNWRKI